MRRRLGLAARGGLWLLAAALLMEAGLRLAFSVDAVFRRVKGRDDASFRIEWVRRHTATGEIALRFDVHHPTRGWALRPGITGMPVFEGKTLNSNSRGVRGEAEHADEPPPGILRILVLGDSYTFGEEVSDDETYASVLGTLLPGVEVLNLGVHGYRHDQMLLYLQEEGVRYHPDVVVLGYVWFDRYRALRAFNSFAKPRFDLGDGGLELTGTPVPSPGQILEAEAGRLRLLDLGVMLREKLRWTLGTNERRARELTIALLDEIHATARRMGAALTIAYLPVLEELGNPEPAMTPDERFLGDYCDARGIRCLFLRPALLAAQREGQSFATRSHWMAPEHRTAAVAIRDGLVRAGLVAGGASPAAMPAGPPSTARDEVPGRG